MNIEALKEAIKNRGVTNAEVAKALDVDESTFYRKIHSKSFTVDQASALAELLKLDKNTAHRIFFTD